MATGNCPGDNTEKTAAAKARVRTDIKGCLYPRQAGLSVRACGSEVTRPFTIFMGQAVAINMYQNLDVLITQNNFLTCNVLKP